MPVIPMKKFVTWSSSSKAGGTGKRNEFGIKQYLCLYFEGLFNMVYNLTTWDRRCYLPSEGNRAVDFYRL
jgi:hypothetical protein